MLATYYMGNRYFDLGDYGKAIKCYLKAEEMAKGLADHHYTGLIDGSIAQVYEKIYNTKEEAAYMERSYGEHCKSNIERHILSSLNHLIIAYHRKHESDRVIELCDSALKLDAMAGYPGLRRSIECTKGYTQIRQKDYTGAIATLEKVSDELSDAPAHLYRNIGMAYYSLGDTAKAEEWLGKIDPATGDENYIPWEVYADRGDYREAFNALRAEYRDIDRRVSAMLRDNVSSAVAEYGEETVREASERAAGERRQKYMMAGVLMAVVIAGTAGFGVYRRYETKRLREVMAMVDEARPEVGGATGKDNGNEEPFALYMKRFDRLTDLCNNYFAAGNDEKRQKSALAAVRKVLRDFRHDKGTLYDLERYFNICNDGMMTRFREDFPNLSSGDSLLMLLLFTGFSSSAICLISGVKMQTLYNRKSFLRKIIGRSTSPRKEKYLSFCHRLNGHGMYSPETSVLPSDPEDSNCREADPQPDNRNGDVGA